MHLNFPLELNGSNTSVDPNDGTAAVNNIVESSIQAELYHIDELSHKCASANSEGASLPTP